MEEQQKAYRVESDDDGFEVVDANGRAIIGCRDQASAEHYATLMNEAFRAGYRAGFREAKRTARQ